jgi:hypothetical protein
VPGQVDGNVVEVETRAATLGTTDARFIEVLWGTAGTIPTKEATVHGQVVEVATIAGTHGMVDGAAAETLWVDLSFEHQIDGASAESLWGTAGTIPVQELAYFGNVVEVESRPEDLGQLQASMLETLLTYPLAIAAVSDIGGFVGAPATFDGTTSLGFISQYRWNWVSVPVGSLIGNGAITYPNFGGTTPIDMSSNAALYHAEETVGVTGADTSGSGNTANLTAITVGVGGQVGAYSWAFTGTTSKAQPTSVIPIPGEWTIAFWFFNLAPNTSWRTGSRGQAADHHIIVETGGDRLGVFMGSFQPSGFSMPSASYTGWHQIAAVGSGTNTLFYVDGVLAGEVEGLRSTDPVHTLGNHSADNQRFADRLDELAVWNRALTPSEISDLFILQEGNYTGVGGTHTFTPDIDGVYTINLTVVDGTTGGLDVDTATATIALGGGLKFPLQGDSISMWSHLQGQLLRKRGQE